MIAPNTILGSRYRVIRPLGGGGMKQVYLAEDIRLDSRPCALAEMIDSFTDPREAQTVAAAFQREADLLAHLNHDRVVRIYDRFSEANRHYLVMEYVEGETLEQRLQVAPGKRLAPEFVIEVSLQILEALEYLHGCAPPVVYRDLKPANVMIAAGGRIKLIDFGIARLFAPKATGTMVGSQGYAAPEQYEGKAEPRSDLYALGATMFHLLTGWDPAEHPPFMFPAIQTLRSEIDPALAGLITESLQLNLSHRIGTAAEFRRRLEHTVAPDTSGLRAAAPMAQPALVAASAAPTAISLAGASCPNCGKPIPADARFCPYCSADLTAAPGPTMPGKRRSAARIALWAIGTLAIFILAFGAVYRFQQYKAQQAAAQAKAKIAAYYASGNAHYDKREYDLAIADYGRAITLAGCGKMAE